MTPIASAGGKGHLPVCAAGGGTLLSPPDGRHRDTRPRSDGRAPERAGHRAGALRGSESRSGGRARGPGTRQDTDGTTARTTRNKSPQNGGGSKTATGRKDK